MCECLARERERERGDVTDEQQPVGWRVERIYISTLSVKH